MDSEASVTLSNFRMCASHQHSIYVQQTEGRMGAWVHDLGADRAGACSSIVRVVLEGPSIQRACAGLRAVRGCTCSRRRSDWQANCMQRGVPMRAEYMHVGLEMQA